MRSIRSLIGSYLRPSPADDHALLLGHVAARLQTTHSIKSLAEVEFKVWSQFGDDGIINYLVSRAGGIPDTFVEFGVSDYSEANTRFLLEARNWRGLVMDSSEENVSAIKAGSQYWRHDLTALRAFITRDNINDLILGAGFSGPIGLLSIDIDGNDYWAWEAIDCIEPAIVVVEYNSVFGSERAVTVPYDPSFDRTAAHHSALYWGTSIGALAHLGRRKGYTLVGSNSAGNNAHFVRDRMVGDLPRPTVREAYVESRFRESRDREGRLSFLRSKDRLRAISGMPLVDVESGETTRCEELG